MNMIPGADGFNATVTLPDGARITVYTENLDALLKTLSHVGYTKTPITFPDIYAVGETKKDAAAAAAPAPKSPTPSTTAPAASSAPTTAPAPAVASPSEPARPEYDEIRVLINALAKVSLDVAKSVLAQFNDVSGKPCTHGNKLQPDDYAAFVAAANKTLAESRGLV
jgi:hypothetical protein